MFKNKNGCFDCDNCPKTNDQEQKRYCVAWLEMVETNSQTGEQRVSKSCGIPQIFRLLVQNTAANDRVTENVTGLPGRMRKEFPALMGKTRQ